MRKEVLCLAAAMHPMRAVMNATQPSEMKNIPIAKLLHHITANAPVTMIATPLSYNNRTQQIMSNSECQHQATSVFLLLIERAIRL